ncbi:MAG: hypothetical protein QHJ82_17170, partial [Verrucomicrobiota bacterium]|nr:hypothetical protein [Verrucomicrobiota bacterium]
AVHPRQRCVQWGLDQRALPSDGVAGHISQPGVAEGARQRAQAPSLRPQGNFGSGFAGLENMRAEHIQSTGPMSFPGYRSLRQSPQMW